MTPEVSGERPPAEVLGGERPAATVLGGVAPEPPPGRGGASADGDLIDLEPSDSRVLLQTPEFTWIDVDDPRGSSLQDLAARYDFHELAVEDCRNHPQLAKVDVFADHLFLIANSIRFDTESEKLDLREIDFFLSRRYLVTVHEGPSVSIESVLERIRQGYSASGSGYVLYAVLDAIIDRFMPTLDQIGQSIEEIEEVILENLDPECLRKMFLLRRNLISFRRAASAQRELLNTLSRRESEYVPPELVIYFRDVYDHIVTTMELIESYRDLLTGALDIYMTRAANRTNETVKALTLIATIILPLTLVTGWYGMNVVNLPFAEHPNGVWFVTGGMAAFTATLLAYFRGKGWL